MNHPNTKSNLINYEGSSLALFLWIGCLVLSVTRGSFLVLVVSFIILALEKQSTFLRNHAGQVAAFLLSSYVLNFLLSVIFGNVTFLFSFARFVNNVVYVLFGIVLALLFLAYSLIGIFAVMQKRILKLPFIGDIGVRLDESINPNET